MSEYADRDIITQGEHYVRHISAMTAEGLHDKSDIAAELAHRDILIAGISASLDWYREALEWLIENKHVFPNAFLKPDCPIVIKKMVGDK